MPFSSTSLLKSLCRRSGGIGRQYRLKVEVSTGNYLNLVLNSARFSLQRFAKKIFKVACIEFCF